MANGNGKERRITARKRQLKLRKSGSQRKKREAAKSTPSYLDLFGETKAEFDAKSGVTKG